jgi:integrase
MTSSKENPTPLLFTYLFGEAAATAFQGASERLLLWASAFEAWLEELLQRNKLTSVAPYWQAWQRLLGQVRKMPWELSQGDLEGHLAWLNGEGYSLFMVYCSMRKVSAFYRWCSLHGVDPECPPGFNPTVGVSNPCPLNYSGAKLLSRGEVQRLLETLQRDESPVGRRNYAFILGRLRLGVRLGHLQKLQWGQVEVGEGGARLRWREGGDLVRLPDEIWEAIQGYLAAAGRLAGMQASSYVFAPLSLPEREEIGERASDWREGRAITVNAMGDILKRYGTLAHLSRAVLSLEGLRLTALRLKLDEGRSLEEMRVFMDSRSPLKTIKFRLKNLPALPPDPIQELPEGLTVTVPSHKQFIFQPGEGYKHGMFAHSQPPERVKAVLAEDIHGIEEAFAGLHLLGRGLLERQAQASSTSEMARLGDAYTLTASRLGEMRRVEREMAGGEQGSRERASRIESVLDGLVRSEASQGRLTTREAVLADLRAQAMGGGAELAITAQALEEAVASIRLVLRNTLDLALQAGSVDEYIYLVNIYSSGCSRLVRLLRDGQVDDERLISYIREQILLAIAEVSREKHLSV